MAVNKIVCGDTVELDLTNDNVRRDRVFLGDTFHGSDGNQYDGTFSLDDEILEQEQLLVQIISALDGRNIDFSKYIPRYNGEVI